MWRPVRVWGGWRRRGFGLLVEWAGGSRRGPKAGKSAGESVWSD